MRPIRTLITATVAVLCAVLAARVRAQPEPSPMPAQVSCDLRATRGYCIGMTVMTPGSDDMVAACPGDGGTVIGVCPGDDDIAICSLPMPPGSFHAREYHYVGTGPHRWTVARARAACATAGGELQGFE